MKRYLLPLLFLGVTALLAVPPIQYSNFTTNKPVSTSQFAAGIETGGVSGTGAVVLSNAPVVLNLDSITRIRTTSLLVNSILATNSAASGLGVFDSSGNLTSATNVPSHATTNIVASGGVTGATIGGTTSVSSPSGLFNTLRMTNGAAAGIPAVSDASGNFLWAGGASTNVALNYLRNFAWRDYCAFAGASAGASYGFQSGTFSVGSSVFNTGTTNLTSIDMTTTASSNNAAGFFSEQAFSAAANNQMCFVLTPTNIANIRVFIGIARAVNQTTMVASDDPGVDAAGFHFVANGSRTNTTWQYYTCDNSTTSESDTLVTTTTTPTVFWIIGNDGGTSWDFWINGNYIGTKSANTPRTTQAYEITCSISTQTSSVKTLRLFLVRGRTRSVIP